ncbi:MAG TPA: LLM class F420-dependent oxidoreductase [Microlunatus sp.]
MTTHGRARKRRQIIDVGLHALGIGTGADPETIRASATEAERRGFATLWAGEHVVMVDDGESPYPYADDGKIAVPPAADWLDPMITLSYAAAVTSTIRLATGILLLPEHNPVVVAKQVASLDRLSGGRFALGVGIGWSAEEFRALGVPFERRGARTAAYVAAMRTLWAQQIGSFESEFVSFEAIRVNPKPVQESLAVIVGGNSDSALRRVAAWGDGWYGFHLDGVTEVAERLETLRTLCAERGRDAAELHLAVALRSPEPADRDRLRELGVSELVIVDSPPADPGQVSAWIADLSDRWLLRQSSPEPAAPTPRQVGRDRRAAS